MGEIQGAGAPQGQAVVVGPVHYSESIRLTSQLPLAVEAVEAAETQLTASGNLECPESR